MKLLEISGMQQQWPKKKTGMGSGSWNEALSEVEGIEIELDEEAVISVIRNNLKEWEDLFESRETRPKIPNFLAKALCSHAKEIVKVAKTKSGNKSQSVSQ